MSEHVDYSTSLDLAVTLEMLVQIGAKIKSTEEIETDRWEIKYEL